MIMHFNVNNSQTLKVCPHCGCVFTYNFDDDAYYDGDREVAIGWYIACPDCDAELMTDWSASNDLRRKD